MKLHNTTVSFSSQDFNRFTQVLQKNPEQFQAIGVVKINHDMNLTIKVSNTQIYCEDVV